MILVFAALGCEQPWELWESGTTDEELRSALKVDDALWTGTKSGRLMPLKRGRGSTPSSHDVLRRDGTHLQRPLKALVMGEGRVLYGWMDGALVRGTAGSLAEVPLPVDISGHAQFPAWAPTALAARDGQVFVANRTGETARPVGSLWESNNGVFGHASFQDGTNAQVSWVAVGADGRTWAGNSVDEAVTVFLRTDTAWVAQPPMGLNGALRVAATANHFFLLTEDGIRAVTTATPRAEAKDLALPGRFTDICAAPDGRVAVVGKSRLPYFPLWVLIDGRWANVNTGTREALWAVHCASDSRLYVVGGHGVALAEDPH